MNLHVYWEYKERICTYMENTRIEVNLQTKFPCSHTENIRNESVCILKIRERICMYTVNMRNAWKVEYLGEFETKIENILGRLSEASMVLIGQIN